MPWDYWLRHGTNALRWNATQEGILKWEGVVSIHENKRPLPKVKWLHAGHVAGRG